MNAEEIARALGGRRSGKGWLAKCPAHDDKRPSLAIDEGSNGKVLVVCRAGCSQADLIDTLAITTPFQLKPHAASREGARLVLVSQIPGVTTPNV